MPGSRLRNAAGTRAALLVAARRHFGREGYERTSLRAIAADAGVDPALIHRYFGSKQELFAVAADTRIEVPSLDGVPPARFASVILPAFFSVWEKDGTFLALLRSAMTSEAAAETLRQVYATQVAPAVAAVVPDHARQRAVLLGTVIIGLATTRYALAIPDFARPSQAELIAWLGPIVEQILARPLPTPS